MFQRFGSFQICNSKVSQHRIRAASSFVVLSSAGHSQIACLRVCVCLFIKYRISNAIISRVFISYLFFFLASDFRLQNYRISNVTSVLDWSSSAISNQSSFLAFCLFQLLLLHTAYNAIYSTTTNHTNYEIQWEEPVDSSDAALLVLLNTIYHTNPHSV